MRGLVAGVVGRWLGPRGRRRAGRDVHGRARLRLDVNSQLLLLLRGHVPHHRVADGVRRRRRAAAALAPPLPVRVRLGRLGAGLVSPAALRRVALVRQVGVSGRVVGATQRRRHARGEVC